MVKKKTEAEQEKSPQEIEAEQFKPEAVTILVEATDGATDEEAARGALRLAQKTGFPVRIVDFDTIDDALEAATNGEVERVAGRGGEMVAGMHDVPNNVKKTATTQTRAALNKAKSG